MNFVVDSGNSAAKVGIFDHQTLVEKRIFAARDDLKSFMSENYFANLIISSVKDDAELIASWANRPEKTFILKKDLPLPVRNQYQTPDTLGMDRLAAVCGGKQLFPGNDCLIIDAGTCVTFDFVDATGVYYGGSISPGLSMRFQAMHTFTAKLPLVSSKPHVELIGKTTESCMQSGVVNGMLAEIDGVIAQYKENFPELQVILCGGDAGFFENQLKASIFASPELVLIGLNSILNYNVAHS